MISYSNYKRQFNESSALSDVLKQIDDLFDELKKRIKNIASPRSSWLSNIRNWMFNKHESLGLQEYHDYKTFCENFQTSLNENTVDLDKVIDQYRDELKNIIQNYTKSVTQQVGTPAAVTTPTTPTKTPTTPSKPNAAAYVGANYSSKDFDKSYFGTPPQNVEPPKAVEPEIKPEPKPAPVPEPPKAVEPEIKPEPAPVPEPPKAVEPEVKPEPPKAAEPLPEPQVTSTPVGAAAAPKRRGRNKATEPSTPPAEPKAPEAPKTTLSGDVDEKTILGAAIHTARNMGDETPETIQGLVQSYAAFFKKHPEKVAEKFDAETREHYAKIGHEYLQKQADSSVGGTPIGTTPVEKQETTPVPETATREELMDMEPKAFKKFIEKNDPDLLDAYEDDQKWWKKNMRQDVVDAYEWHKNNKSKLESVGLRAVIDKFKNLLRRGTYKLHEEKNPDLHKIYKKYAFKSS